MLTLDLKYSLVAVVGLTFASCGPATSYRAPRPDELRTVSDGRAAELVREVASETGIRLQSGWQIDAGGSESFTVDLRIADTAYGVEWVGPQDRADHGQLLPEPNEDGALQILPGAGDDGEAQVLVLDYRTYRYDPDLERVQRGSTGVREAESRLRRDVRDYVEYVRGQGALQ